ncbi:MAG: excalibur calcium-binding domain-containing protein [Xanthomonadales bacterium]|nr:excalibur calcium-binding domain-containing protein [Xanthomonadales bacterium]
MPHQRHARSGAIPQHHPQLDDEQQRRTLTNPSEARQGPRLGASPWRGALASVAGLAVIAAMGGYGSAKIAGSHIAADSVPAQPASITQRTTSIESTFTCDGRKHCSQMTSCAEATCFIQHCPDTQMDGDYDGRPCESQWCSDGWGY